MLNIENGEGGTGGKTKHCRVHHLFNPSLFQLPIGTYASESMVLQRTGYYSVAKIEDGLISVLRFDF